ncbi:unnamed protein product, partial [marine sediment metagenome]
FTDAYSTTSGVTAVSLVGSATYIVGDSYQEALDTVSTYAADPSVTDDVGDVTQRYGDELRGETTANVVDWTEFDWTTEGLDFTDIEFSEGGIFFCYTTVTSQDETDWVGISETDGTAYSGLIMRVDDGSDSANVLFGTHYFTLSDISYENDVAGASCRIYVEPAGSTGRALVDLSANVPTLCSAGSFDTTATLFCPSGPTYRETIEEIQVDDKLTIGDDSGYIYQFGDTDYDYDGDDIISRHPTAVIDGGEPDLFKRWPGIAIVARERTSG